MNLSPYGAKIALAGNGIPLAPRANIGLRLALPDGELAVSAMVVRMDPDGVALNFGNLEARQFQRLKDLVDSLLMQEWRELLVELQGGSPVPITVPSAEPEPTPAETPRVQAAVAAPAAQPSVFNRQRGGRPAPPKPPAAPGEDNPETERLRALLKQLGLGDLQLPPGPLTGHWREFLSRHEAQP